MKPSNVYSNRSRQKATASWALVDLYLGFVADADAGCLALAK